MECHQTQMQALGNQVVLEQSRLFPISLIDEDHGINLTDGNLEELAL